MGYKSQVQKTFSYKTGMFSSRRRWIRAVLFCSVPKPLYLSSKQKNVAQHQPAGGIQVFAFFDPHYIWKVTLLCCNLGIFPFGTKITHEGDKRVNALGEPANKREKGFALGSIHSTHESCDSSSFIGCGKGISTSLKSGNKANLLDFPHHLAWDDVPRV